MGRLRREYGMVGAVTQRAFPPVQPSALSVSRARQLPGDSPHPEKSLFYWHSQAGPPPTGATLYRAGPSPASRNRSKSWPPPVARPRSAPPLGPAPPHLKQVEAGPSPAPTFSPLPPEYLPSLYPDRLLRQTGSEGNPNIPPVGLTSRGQPEGRRPQTPMSLQLPST